MSLSDKLNLKEELILLAIKRCKDITNKENVRNSVKNVYIAYLEANKELELLISKGNSISSDLEMDELYDTLNDKSDVDSEEDPYAENREWLTNSFTIK